MNPLKLWSAVFAVGALIGCFSSVDVGSDERSTQAEPLCRPGADELCNADPSLSAPSGTCVVTNDGLACLCRPGFAKTDAGRCAPTGTQACTVGTVLSCTELDWDGGAGLGGGQCVAGDSGPQCICSAGFERNPSTGRCRRTPPSCGASSCGACPDGCLPRSACTDGQWQCDCACAAVCTVGDNTTCWATWGTPGPNAADAGSALDAGRAPEAGQCVLGASGPQCICNVGFTPTSDGRCAPTGTQVCTLGEDQSCNAVPFMSSFAGTCVPLSPLGTACVCGAGFVNDATGRCAPRDLCYETSPTGCRYVYPDGTVPANGTCGTMSLPPGCACSRDLLGDYHAQCLGACMPTDSGRTLGCFASCGPIHCVEGQTTCAAFGVCQ